MRNDIITIGGGLHHPEVTVTIESKIEFHPLSYEIIIPAHWKGAKEFVIIEDLLEGLCSELKPFMKIYKRENILSDGKIVNHYKGVILIGEQHFVHKGETI